MFGEKLELLGRMKTYTREHGSHAQAVALVSVGQVGEDLRCGRNGDTALVSDFYKSLVPIISHHCARRILYTHHAEYTVDSDNATNIGNPVSTVSAPIHIIRPSHLIASAIIHFRIEQNSPPHHRP